MQKNELIYLFKLHLGRECTESEIKTHVSKNYREFEKEITNCKEYKERALTIKTKQKIAILLTGHIRKMNVVDTIQKFCKDYDYDIFIHTWDNVGIKGTETNLSSKTDFNGVENAIKKIDNLKDYIIENNKEYIDSIDRTETYFNFSSPEEFIKSQLYSINKCFNLMKEYSESQKVDYKLVIRLRFDSEITDFYVDDLLIDEMNKYDLIFVPNEDSGHLHEDNATSCWACDKMYYDFNLKNVHIFEHTNVICDFFAYGSIKSMESYCSLYHHYDDMIKTYVDENKKSILKNNISHTIKDGTYYIDKTDKCHIDTLYYLYCSYPERLLQKLLKDYMLIQSRKIKVNFKR